MKRVVIILVNWKGGADTVECLESIFLSDYPLYTVVVCDNNSSDDSLSRLRSWARKRRLPWREIEAREAPHGGEDGTPLVIITSDRNLGFAGGNNLGMRYALASGDLGYVWLLNNDTVVEPDALRRLVERMAEKPSAGICGSTIRHYHSRDRVQALGGGHYYCLLGVPWHHGRFARTGTTIDAARAERSMNYVEGASMLVSRRFLEEVGLMCEDYFLYFEEADWAARGRGRFTLAYAPLSVVYHKVGASIGTSSNPAMKSYMCDYFNIRNRILFTRRFHPAALPTVYMILGVELLIRLFLGKLDRVAMIMGLLFGRCDSRMECASRVGSLL